MKLEKFVLGSIFGGGTIMTIMLFAYIILFL